MPELLALKQNKRDIRRPSGLMHVYSVIIIIMIIMILYGAKKKKIFSIAYLSPVRAGI